MIETRQRTVGRTAGWWAAGLVLALAVGFGLGRATGPAGASRQDTAASPVELGEQSFTCSMHPQVRSPDPKEKCPICGMDLIPVPRGGEEGDGSEASPQLALSPRSLALLQPQTVPAARRLVDVEVTLPGMVVVDESRLAEIAAWVSGRLERLAVNRTGVEVRAGDPLATIYSPALVAAQEELRQALAALGRLPGLAAPAHRAGAEALVAAARDKLRLLGVPAERVAAIEQGGEVEEVVTLLAPVSGVVLERRATAGAVVERGEVLYRLAPLDRVWVELEAWEKELAWLRVGVPVEVMVAALPKERLVGRVALVGATVDGERRTAVVRVELANLRGALKPGMLVTGVARPPAGEALVIPATAPLRTGRRAVVFVQVKDRPPTYAPREVVLGSRVGGEVIVLEGLGTGELVVVNGQFKLDSELQIRGRPSMMGLGDGQPTQDAGPLGGEHTEAKARGPLAPLLAALLEGNFALVEALAGDDAAAARRAAARVQAALAKGPPEALPGREAIFWQKVAARIEASLKGIGQRGDIEEMREDFEVFSDALTEAVRRWGTGREEPVFRAKCPMVRGRTAYWLQPQAAITNPYHGERMYACGEIVEKWGAAEGGRP